eukprot:2097877-Rhodomonas_salina.1
MSAAVVGRCVQCLSGPFRSSCIPPLLSAAPDECFARTEKMRTVLYGKKAANLYTQAFVQNTQARA